MNMQAPPTERVNDLEGRWCTAVVWKDRYPGGGPPGYLPCGGELRHARQVEGEGIVTYLICLLCGAKRKTMEQNGETGVVVIHGEDD